MGKIMSGKIVSGKTALMALGAAAAVMSFSAAAQAQPLEATCPSVSYRGPIIVATCYNAAMGLVRSSIDTSTCVTPVGNVNGQLLCQRGGYGGYGGGYGYGRPRYDRGY